MSAVPPELLIFSHSMAAIQYSYICTNNRPVIAQANGAPTDEMMLLLPAKSSVLF